MKKLCVFWIVWLFPFSVYAQDSMRHISAKNIIYAEVWGNTYHYSLNYERIILQPRYFKMSIRTGIGMLPAVGFYEGRNYNAIDFSLPIELNVMVGKKSNYLDIGIGYAYDYTHGFQTRIAMFIGWNDSILIANGIDPSLPFHVPRDPPPPLDIWDVHRLTYRVSYRHQSPQSGWFWRIGIGNSYFISDKHYYINYDTMRFYALGFGRSF